MTTKALNYTWENTLDFTFDAAGTNSDAQEYFGNVRGAVVQKSVTLDAETTITFQGRDNAGTWHTIQDSTGTAVSLTFAASGALALVCPAEAWGFPAFEEIRLVASPSPRAGSATVFTLKGLS